MEAVGSGGSATKSGHNCIHTQQKSHEPEVGPQTALTTLAGGLRGHRDNGKSTKE